MDTTIDLSGLDRLGRKFGDLAALDYTPLMAEWERILWEENRDGLLRGEDGAGNPMPPTWRENHPEGYWFRRKGQKAIHVLGSLEAGDGPPLIPHGIASRAITRARTGSGRDGVGAWFATLGWQDFVSDDNRPILAMHANPVRAPYPRRDILKVRPNAVKRAREALRVFVSSLLRGAA